MKEASGVDHIRPQHNVKLFQNEPLRGERLFDVETFESHERIPLAEMAFTVPFEGDGNVCVNVFDAVAKFANCLRDKFCGSSRSSANFEDSNFGGVLPPQGRRCISTNRRSRNPI